MALILIPDRMAVDDSIESRVASEHEIHLARVESIKEISTSILAKVEAVILWHQVHLNEEAIKLLVNCRAIVRAGAGIENLDIEAATRQGIQVSAINDYGVEDVADHALALLLSLGRGLDRFQSEVKKRQWSWDLNWNRKRLRTTKLGIVGLGKIGTAVALRARPFFEDILFFDPYRQRGFEKSLNIKQVHELKDIALQCDAITFHCPLTTETMKMVDSSFLSNCRKDAILVNTARGNIVDLDALYENIRSAQIGLVGMDVHEGEPNYRHPLIQAYLNNEEWIQNRMILTPHSAFLNSDSIVELRTKAVEEACRILTGLRPLYSLN